MNNIKNIRKNSIIILFITIIILAVVMKDDFYGVLDLLVNVNLYWILVAIIFLLIYWCCKAFAIYLLAKEYKNDIKFLKMLKHIIIVQFFSAITPFSTGGEPISIYMLKKKGIRITNATSIIVQDFLMYQISLVLYGIIAVILNYHFGIFEKVALLRKLVTLGFIINLLVCIILIFITFSRKFNKLILKVIVSIGNRLKFIKDKNGFYLKYQNKLEEFHESSKLYKDKKSVCFKVFICNFIGLGVFYLIPLFVIFSFLGHTSLNIVNALVSSAYVFMIGSFVPIPGGSGGIEYGFTQFFGSLISGNVLSACLLMWRFITYYITILVGAITFNINRGDVINENRNIY